MAPPAHRGGAITSGAPSIPGTPSAHAPSTDGARGRVIRAAGALDGSAVELLLGAAHRLMKDGVDHVTLDLTAVTGIDSDAVRALFAAQFDARPDAVLQLIVADRLRPRLAVCRLADPMPDGPRRRLVLAEAS